MVCEPARVRVNFEETDWRVIQMLGNPVDRDLGVWVRYLLVAVIACSFRVGACRQATRVLEQGPSVKTDCGYVCCDRQADVQSSALNFASGDKASA